MQRKVLQKENQEQSQKTKAIGKRKGVPARRKTTNNGKKRRK
jgi:hypothetical protein